MMHPREPADPSVRSTCAISFPFSVTKNGNRDLFIPDDLKKVFKTVWEMSQKALIDLSVGRAPFICQAQSLNLYIAKPTRAVLSSMGFYAWSKGLKTGQYYLRSQPEARAIQFTVKKGMIVEEEEECIMCSA